MVFDLFWVVRRVFPHIGRTGTRPSLSSFYFSYVVVYRPVFSKRDGTLKEGSITKTGRYKTSLTRNTNHTFSLENRVNHTFDVFALLPPMKCWKGLTKSLFPRNLGLFWWPKWLFCEGFLKVSEKWTRELFLEVFVWPCFMRAFLRLFGSLFWVLGWGSSSRLRLLPSGLPPIVQSL